MGNFKRLCYFTSWSQKRKNVEARTNVEDIDPLLCTHVIYAFVDSTLEGAEWDDESTPKLRGNYEKLNDLNKVNPRLRTLLSIGGAKAGSWQFEEIVDSPDDRPWFVNNVVDFLRLWKFDGLDVDWEFPDRAGKLELLVKVGEPQVF